MDTLERAPLSSLTNLQVQNQPFPTFNKPIQRDVCDVERRHDSTTRLMGSGKCTVAISQFRGERVFCLCQQGVFNYNSSSNVLDNTCQDCLHTAVQHESLSASEKGRSVSSPPLHIIELSLNLKLYRRPYSSNWECQQGPINSTRCVRM